MPIQVTVNEVNRGRNVILEFMVNNISKGDDKAELGVFNINDAAEVWIDFESNETEDNCYRIAASISMKKHASALDFVVKLSVVCEVMNYSEQFSCPQFLSYGSDIGEATIPIHETYSLKVNLIASKTEKITFAKLYDDTDLIDFHLSTEEGSVAVHKTCLALHSDMFNTMLCGKWKETTDGRVEIKGFTLQTLQQLKDYIYLGTLPDDVCPLLLLAKCYLLNNLKEECLMKLARTVSPKNLYELQEYACENNVIELSHMLLQLATDDVVQAANLFKKPQPTLNTETENATESEN